MPQTSIITTQLVHLEGPRKGQIDEFQQNKITIGRDPASDVVLPADLLTISRHHSELVREGNRYRLRNKGRNPCLLNGQLADQVWLKSGDVITLVEDGPKISFLSHIEAAPAVTLKPTELPAATPPPVNSMQTDNCESDVAAFTLQYGIQIRTLNQKSVKIGKSRNCDFTITHPKVCDQHALLLHKRGNYYVRDLSGAHITWLNQRTIRGDAALQDNDSIQLGENGPELKYIGDGRFIELMKQPEQADIEKDWSTQLVDDIETHKAFENIESNRWPGIDFLIRLFKRY